jgi:hypothetical protein
LARNRWGIPEWLERELLARDVACMYCGVRFGAPDAPRRYGCSMAHVVSDAPALTKSHRLSTLHKCVPSWAGVLQQSVKPVLSVGVLVTG